MIIVNPALAVLDEIDDRCLSRYVEQTGSLDSYDPRVRQIFCTFLQPGDVVLDGGAFIGDHTVAYAEAVGESGHVVAFEPNPSARACLVFNTRRFPQVEVVPAALADGSGTLPLFIDHENAGATSVSTEPDDAPKTISVISTTIDAANWKRLDFIKLDLEGMELRALIGGQETLKRLHPIVIVETGAHLQRCGDSHELLVKFMGDLGYWMRPLPPRHPSDVEVYDVLFWPKATA